MKLLIEIASIVLPVFSVFFLGAALKRVQWIDNHFIAQANRLVFNICLPLLLFYKIGDSNFFAHFNPLLLVACSAAILVTFSASYLFAALRGYQPPVRGAFCQGSFRCNLAIIGLAIVFNAYNDEGLTRASVLMGFLVPLLNLFAILALLLPHHKSRAMGLSFWLRQVLLNPLIIASLAGIAWSVAGLPMPAILENSLKIVTQMTLPLALLAIGAGFTLQRLHGDLRRAGLAAGFKIVFMPVLTGFLLWLFGVRGLDFAVGVLMIGSPTAAVSYIMASQMKGDVELAGSIIIISTFLSMLSYTLILLALNLSPFAL
ncbi:MAG: AEC family transporter [Candidatus Omnitrophica bacterium]|nr:AEC family transporter [Candidatus Omnitrophota bacterium]